jgi:SNF2 family DNA or RNA helicase
MVGLHSTFAPGVSTSIDPHQASYLGAFRCQMVPQGVLKSISESITLAEQRLGIQLKPYQVDAILHQWRCLFKEHGALVAYEPGLGKTLIGLVFAFCLLRYFARENATARKEKKREPFPIKILVTAPLSVLDDAWETHAPKLFPGHQYYVHHDDRTSKNNIRAFEDAYVVGVSYGIVTRDYINFKRGDTQRSNIFNHQFAAILADEITVIKNGTSLDASRSSGPIIAKAMFRLSENAVMRTALTGTPVSNSLSDLTSIIRFLHPHSHKHDKSKPFAGHWSESQVWKDVAKIQNHVQRKARVAALTKPFMIWMSKDDARAPPLPSITREVKFLRLTSAQRSATQEAVRQGIKLVKAYNTIGARNSTAETSGHPGDDDQRRQLRGRIMALFVRLRRICDSVHLDDGKHELKREEFHMLSEHEDAQFDVPEDEAYLDTVLRDSCKFSFLLPRLDVALQAKQKVVIFVHWTMSSSLLKALLERHWHASGLQQRVEIFDGKVSKRSDRVNILQRFRSNFEDGNNVLLISAQCGGVGLDLSVASVGIVISPDYTGASEYQMDNRLHRPGQKNPVTMLRLICDDTSIETHIRNIQIRKEEDTVRTVTPHATLIKYEASEAETTSTFSAVLQYLLSMDHKHKLSEQEQEGSPHKRARM